MFNDKKIIQRFCKRNSLSLQNNIKNYERFIGLDSGLGILNCSLPCNEGRPLNAAG